MYRGHTDLNHGPTGLQPVALPLSYIPLLMQLSYTKIQSCCPSFITPDYCYEL